MTTEQSNLLAEESNLVETTTTPTISHQTTPDEVRDVVEEIDYKTWSKDDLLKAFTEATKTSQVQQGLKIATKVKTALEEKFAEERQIALDKFIEDGGVEDDFEYKNDTQLKEIEKEFKQLKNKQKEFFNDLNRKKQVNYETRLELLAKLRLLVDGQKNGYFQANTRSLEKGKSYSA